MPRLNNFVNAVTFKRRSILMLAFAIAATSAVFSSVQTVSAAKDPTWKSLFDGKTLKNWTSTNFGGEGDVAVKDGVIVMQQGSDMTGITWTGEDLPKMNYEVVVRAQRIEGNDFFCGLTFEINEDPCSLIIGGWGGGVVGISSLDGLDAANNETARYESFESGEWYTIRLRVSELGLMAWIDEKQVVSVATKGKKISIRGEVEPSRPFGISCFATTAGLKEIKVRPLSAEEAKAPLTPAEDNRTPLPKKKKK
ncbi:3-keto-disaccharide hydrolase [Schlesneria paludicola]|uniref:3-keto-disaccharide hydrolase n=1 Tax=Schlesneria paludicola TaxID=360056 RepID=UPI0012F8973C|nr:DUF1080 domain-containing protein [Schlesneria paludicola]